MPTLRARPKAWVVLRGSRSANLRISLGVCCESHERRLIAAEVVADLPSRNADPMVDVVVLRDIALSVRTCEGDLSGMRRTRNKHSRQ